MELRRKSCVVWMRRLWILRTLEHVGSVTSADCFVNLLIDVRETGMCAWQRAMVALCLSRHPVEAPARLISRDASYVLHICIHAAFSVCCCCCRMYFLYMQGRLGSLYVHRTTAAAMERCPKAYKFMQRFCCVVSMLFCNCHVRCIYIACDRRVLH